ncbi:amino acid adenylation domain-containing protein [Pseudanabaena sp. FACHB-1998]|uniref:amino acid adenylation domain-containing protein n=1 Tax=Pseudanabaena sp. FACHB-1998 TaxID=2692858 RepID=UPI001680F823|nr:amino acid adenylation domain-containing protein [Pseudanabaena sp. FACHB-1998]MBD2177148.1 amino acid adenylation domain-containing protein [Pseudanabaena sp. FACHB-1998]
MFIQEFLQTQVERHPEAIAIQDSSAQITYQELQTKSDRLASYLQQIGVTSEFLVGIFIERSLDMIIGIISVLKAGGVFIPIDPNYPQERLSIILEESDLSLILTQEKLAQTLPNQELKLVLIDKLEQALTDSNHIHQSSQSTSQEISYPPEILPQDLAYIMYTSGSTGKPQGVEITHSQIECYIKSLNNIIGINSDDIYLHTASFSFSSSIRQLFLPLFNGAKVVISPNNTTKNPIELLELIQREQVTVLDTVSSVWQFILLELAKEESSAKESLLNSKLRILVFSGGLLPCQLLKKVRDAFEQKNQKSNLLNPQIFNIYGQTETIGACAYRVPDDFSQTQGYVPVGKAYDHHQVYILDENLQPVSVGQSGYLYISGISLARGYFKNPRLNQTKFMVNPFVLTNDINDHEYSRLYQTGDVASYLSNGDIQVLGRQDFQVKIRGMRVELEEIETVISQYPDVQQVAVTSQELPSGEHRIFAYIVTNKKAEFSIRKLRSFLKNNLSDYMIPSGFIALDSLPLTPNGKLSRQSLPTIEGAYLLKDEHVAPRTDLEKQLAKIWEEVLQHEPIGITDDFFELGGHSLLIPHLISEIEKQANILIRFSSLPQISTIENLVKLINKKSTTTNYDCLLDNDDLRDLMLRNISIKGVVQIGTLSLLTKLSAQQFSSEKKLIWVGLSNLATQFADSYETYVFPSTGYRVVNSPYDYIKRVANTYAKELISSELSGSFVLIGWCFDALVVYEIAQQLKTLGKQVSQLILIEREFPNHKLLEQTRKFEYKYFSVKLHLQNLTQKSFLEQSLYIAERLSRKLAKFIPRSSSKLSTKSSIESSYRRIEKKGLYEREINIVTQRNFLERRRYVLDRLAKALTKFAPRTSGGGTNEALLADIQEGSPVDKPLKEESPKNFNSGSEQDQSQVDLIWDSIVKVRKGYIPEVYEGNVTLLFCDHSTTPLPLISDMSWLFPSYGWQGYIKGRLRTIVLPGHHNMFWQPDFLNEKHMEDWIEKIKWCIEN